MPEWIKVCDIKSLKNGDLLDFDFGDKTILIAKAGNKIYATDRICTHAYADLSTGFMNENEKTITCPLHMSVFKLEDGNIKLKHCVRSSLKTKAPAIKLRL